MKTILLLAMCGAIIFCGESGGAGENRRYSAAAVMSASAGRQRNLVPLAAATTVLLSFPARLIVSGCALTALLMALIRRAPVGYQDENGFHIVRTRKSIAGRRQAFRQWRVRKRLFAGWLFSDSQRPLKA